MEDEKFIDQSNIVAFKKTAHEGESKILEGVLYDDGKVIPDPDKIDESAMKNFYIKMALSRFRNTLQMASQAKPGSIPPEERAFLEDLGNVVDYVAKLEGLVLELQQKVSAQPDEAGDGEKG